MVYTAFTQYRAAWNEAYRTDPPAPLNLDLELASVCNLACPFCFWGEADFNEEMKKPGPDGKPLKRLMPTALALRLIDEAAEIGVPAIKFNWRGESTIHPDYSRILCHAQKMRLYPGTGGSGPAFHDLLVNTNANFKAHAFDGLMAATKVMVSLDSTEPKTYAKMRAGGTLEMAIYNTRELLRRGHPNVWVRRVMTKDNQHESFAVNVRRIFGSKVKISQHACFDRNADEHHQLNDMRLWKDRTYCGYPSQRLMVASDGRCFPCCVDYDGTMPMGDANEQGLLEIWNGEKMANLRGKLRANDLATASKTCQGCTSWMAYSAPERNLVQDKELTA